jgi:hypothetical protein
VKPYLTDLNTTDKAAGNDFQIDMNSVVAGGNPIGLCDKGENGTVNVANDGWMHDLLCYAWSMSIRRGRTTTSNKIISDHITKWVLGRGVDGCFFSAPSYNIGIRQGANPTSPASPYCTAWSQCYIGNIDNGTLTAPLQNPTGTGCPGPPDVLDATYGLGGYNTFITDYSNMYHLASIVAYTAGITGASAAKTYYDAVEAQAIIDGNVSEAKWGQFGCHMRIRLPA